MRRFSHALALALALVPPTGARAENLPHYSPRELVVRAHTMVLAEALEPFAPKRFRVLEVLHGSGLRAGDTLSYGDLGMHDMHVYPEENLPPGPEPRRPVVQALLFLEAPEGKGPPQPVLSGLRLLTADGVVLVPEQWNNPGPYMLAVRRDLDWDALVRQVRAASAEYSRLLAAKNLARSGPRCRALLEWVERHRREFGTLTDNWFWSETRRRRPGFVFPSAAGRLYSGWGELEQDVFQWILAAGDVEVCWAAVQLYAELNRGAVPPLRTPAFGRKDGRELLLRLALSERRLEGDRVRALALLAHRRTLWTEEPEQSVRPLTEKEQADSIDRLTPLLQDPSAAIRAAAARTLHAASAPRDEALRERQTKRALTALAAAYRREPPGEARDDLAAAVHAIGGPAHWQELTGNPRGLFARLHDFGHRGGKVFFWLHLDAAGLSVHECPTLVLEKLDGRKGGGVAEKKEQPLPVVNLPRPWNEGWNGSGYLLVEVPMGTLAEGTWRLTVRGTAGKDKDKVKWTAEPRTFAVKSPRGLAQAPMLFDSDW
jgi:hypothetical protein